ncbi:MAG: glycosyltransferase family 4 protein [Thermoleophilia bacterium]
MRTVHVVVPAGIDDPARPSGGNVYDRRVCTGLRETGWTVREHEAPGDWPRPGGRAVAALEATLRETPDGAVVLVDGLIASVVPRVLEAHSGRLRLVVLVHMPLGDDGEAREREGAALAAAHSVVATSEWTRRRLGDLHGLDPARIHVATPGVEAAGVAPGSDGGGSLLCVAAVTPGKGHDVLVDALAAVRDLEWRCRCLGSLERDPGFVAALRRRIRDLGLDGRVTLDGPRTGDGLRRGYADADLLVLASRGETYGMVVAEALAHGVPVLATRVGGLPEAAGGGADGHPPGFLVPPDDPGAVATALRTWLSDGGVRHRMRRAARERRATLTGWRATVSVLDGVLAGATR